MEWQQPCDHFFRIILDSTMATKKLILPRLFVESRLDELCGTVMLKAPNSQAWTVDLTVKIRRRNKAPEVWLDAGFSEFLESLSISYGHFLVFEYRGMSKFKVAVYDRTTCEIRYPPCPCSNGSPLAEDDDDDSDDGDGGVIYVGSSFSPPRPDHLMAGRNGSSSSSSSKLRPRETAAETRVPKAADGGYNVYALMRQMMETNIQTSHLVSTILRMSRRSKEAIQRAIASPPANPCAMAVLSSIAPYLPVEFSRTHLGRADMDNSGRWVHLEVAGDGDGRQRMVLIRPQNNTGVIFGKEWRHFCNDHDLVEGDVCLFEVISLEMIKVHIFHASVE